MQCVYLCVMPASTATGSSWEDERTSTAAEPGLGHRGLSGFWESQCTWRFLADWLIVRLSPLMSLHSPSSHWNRRDPWKGSLISRKWTFSLDILLGCSPYHHTHICVVSTMERIRCNGTAVFSLQAERGSGTQHLTPTQNPNHFFPALQSHASQSDQLCIVCWEDTK